MLHDSIKKCPDDLWLEGIPPRTFWRIAYHAVHYTHKYLQQTEANFTPWEHHTKDLQALWGKPKPTEPLTKKQVLDYLKEIDASVDDAVDALDLSAENAGFSIYQTTKIENQMLNLRHLQTHVGQLSELLMARGIEVPWR